MPEAVVTDLAQISLVEQRKNGAMKILGEIYNEKLNAHFLTYLTNGVRFYLFTRKEAQNGRFDGMRLRSVPVYDDFFRSLGGQPVRMAPPEVFTGLERGTVDGYGWPNWGVSDFGWQKYTKFQYGPGFLNAGVHILVNLDKWKGLAEDQRQCLTDMALWVEAEWPKWRAETEKEQQEILDKAGVKYVDLGPDFPKKAADLYWAAIAKANPDFVKKMRPLMEK
jgi:TRAP-type C4-dicarboxylate transport system substrate-binding protein